ncbi:MAG: glycosyltransferase, partial [Vicinamibacteria bacterium]
AKACGTPVIGTARGSVPEIVRSGFNGFICRDAGEAIGAVARLDSIERSRPRNDAEQRFASNVVVDAYESLYLESLVKARKSSPGDIEPTLAAKRRS